jgi:predicted glycosyltransferase
MRYNNRSELRVTKGIKIWIDLDNTPHVPFFVPIIRELEFRGFSVILTARDAFQVCELADEKGILYKRIGRHYGKRKALKIVGMLWRSIQFLPFYLRKRPDLAVSHGARSQILLCKLLGIPTILITDYEHGRTLPLAYPRWVILPESVRGHYLPVKPEHIRYYRGIKEDVYVPDFVPGPSPRGEMGLDSDEIVVTIRPPAGEALYHNPESDILLIEFMKRVSNTPGVRAVLLPRTRQEETRFRMEHPEWFINRKTVVPSHTVDGLGLIWDSDLVVSGGGTMNREAAALGVPVYSIFRGKAAAVDLSLEREGRLILIKSTEEVRSKILFARRDKRWVLSKTARPALIDIVDHIEGILQAEGIGH